MKKGTIVFAIMGKSGSGKSSVISGLVEKNNKYHQVKSYTTRAERLTDPMDGNTHVFVDEDFWEDNKEEALAIYHSPKGYVSWVDKECFLPDKINLYAIDSIAFNNLPKEVFGIYLSISDEARKERYEKREKTLVGFSPEIHLSELHIKRKHITLEVTESDINEMITEVDDSINSLI
ncbi:MAG: hypothetical protein ACRC0V_10935 [Fusobacteriaceae bacterium]